MDTIQYNGANTVGAGPEMSDKMAEQLVEFMESERKEKVSLFCSSIFDSLLAAARHCPASPSRARTCTRARARRYIATKLG